MCSKSESMVGIKVEIELDLGNEVPMESTYLGQDCIVPKIEIKEEEPEHPSVADVKCEYQSDPEYDIQLRKINLGQQNRAETESSEANSKGNKKTNTNIMIYEDETEAKNRYERKLREFYDGHSKNERNVKKPWSTERISQVIRQIKESRVTMNYYWASKYDILNITGEDVLIFKKKTVEDPTIRIVPTEKYYEILSQIHKNVGHGGRQKMIQNIKNKLYIPKRAIEIFIDQCSVCEMKRSVQKKSIVTQPIIANDFNVRGQVDLVDLQSDPDGEYKWLLKYQDHATKFLHLRPLKTKRASEVAMELFKIFMEFGAPCIIQSDHGRDFTAHVVEELVMLWPDCKIIDGSRHPQTQDSVEPTNQDVENMLRCWMQDNRCTKWSIGCYFVQYYQNCSQHSVIGKSPYRALFGSEPKTLLKGCNIPETLITSISTEADQNKVIQKEVPIIENNYRFTDANLLTKTIAEDDYSNIEKVVDTRLVETNINEIGADNNFNTCAKDIPVHDYAEDSLKRLDAKNKNEQVSFDDQRCTVCGQGTSGALSCSTCSKPVHMVCGVSLGEEGYGTNVLCRLCHNEKNIFNEKEQAHRGIKRAAEKMVDATAKKLPMLEIDNSVFVNVPKSDRGPLDTKNILGKVVDIQNGFFKIGTSSGTIKKWFSRQDLQISTQDYTDDISESPISLRQAVTLQSMFSESFQKCSCKPSKNQCHTHRCACLKNKLLCTSKCHKSLSCINK